MSSQRPLRGPLPDVASALLRGSSADPLATPPPRREPGQARGLCPARTHPGTRGRGRRSQQTQGRPQEPPRSRGGGQTHCPRPRASRAALPSSPATAWPLSPPAASENPSLRLQPHPAPCSVHGVPRPGKTPGYTGPCSVPALGGCGAGPRGARAVQGPGGGSRGLALSPRPAQSDQQGPSAPLGAWEAGCRGHRWATASGLVKCKGYGRGRSDRVAAWVHRASLARWALPGHRPVPQGSGCGARPQLSWDPNHTALQTQNIKEGGGWGLQGGPGSGPGPRHRRGT